jgi:2-iminobutanoate/2-iminopropanoate deaminase
MSSTGEGTKITRRGFIATSLAFVAGSCISPGSENKPAPARLAKPVRSTENKSTMKKIIATKNAPDAIGPYSQAVMINGFLYTSGQVAIDPASGEFLMGTIEEETHQVMKNLQAVLTEAGLGFEHVVKTSIFIQDMDDFKAINEVYASYFKGNYPARETVEVARLPKDANVEISMIALKI